MNAAVQDQALVAASESASQSMVAASPAEAHYLLRRRQAVDFSKSTLVPDAYRGNPANVMIALEIADRIGASPLMVMQNLYIVHGRPSWSAQFLIASVNSSKRFTPVRFETHGEDPAAKDYRVRAVATDIKTGDECKGTWITWRMVEGEKWDSKPGSKWKTMPGQMFLYRAATFWTRLYAPEVSMGILTRDELEDMGVIQVDAAAVRREDPKSLEARLLGQQQAPVTDEEMSPPPPHDEHGEVLTVAGVLERIAAAPDRDTLDVTYDLSRQLDVSDEDRKAMFTAYETRADELDA